MACDKQSGLLTIIVAENPEAVHQIKWSYSKIIAELIGEYSQLSLCSSWNDKIEYELWADINFESPHKGLARRDWLSVPVKESILKVATHSQSWVHWDEEIGGPSAIGLPDWKELYSGWLSAST